MDTSEIWTGEAVLYDQTRPAPPPVLTDIFTQLIHTSSPPLVVDLGSGTGLSTLLWAERAKQVIGIEPNADMRNMAISNLARTPHMARVEYRNGFGNQTGLPAESVDIVTCSQAFHWMEPTSTLAEVARILRPGGLFAAYDYDWPPTLHWKLEQLYEQIYAQYDKLVLERGLSQNFARWSKDDHLARMHASNHFRFTRELLVHHSELGNAERFFGLIMTNSFGHHLKQQTISEQEIGLDRLKEAAQQYIGSEPIPWYFSYRVRIGIK